MAKPCQSKSRSGGGAEFKISDVRFLMADRFRNAVVIGDGIEQVGFEAIDDCVPRTVTDCGRSRGGEPGAKRGLAPESHGLGEEGDFVPHGNEQTIFAGADKFMGRGVVEGSDGEAAAERFRDNVAESFRDARVQVDVTRGVQTRQVDAGVESGEHGVGSLALVMGKQRAIADEHEVRARFDGFDGVEGTKEQGIIFFRGHATDVNHHGVVGAGTPHRAQGFVASAGRE